MPNFGRRKITYGNDRERARKGMKASNTYDISSESENPRRSHKPVKVNPWSRAVIMTIACIRNSCQLVEELLDISNPTTEVVESRLHVIEAFFK